MKYVDDYRLDNNEKLYVIKNDTNLKDNSIFVVYLSDIKEIEIKRFSTKEALERFLRSNIYNSKTAKEYENFIVVPVVQICDFNVEYRFISGEKCISFYLENSKTGDFSFINTKGIEDYSNGIYFDQKDLI